MRIIAALRKLCAILLFTIFLFNVVGYRLLMAYIEAKSNKEVVAMLDRDEYNEYDLVTITVPLNLPYETDWKDFERTDGTVTLQGKTYRYVKRKVSQGKLILLCLPEESTRRFDSARSDFFKIANELAENSGANSKSNNSLAGKILSHVFDQPALWQPASNPANIIASFQQKNITAQSIFYPETSGKPPKTA